MGKMMFGDKPKVSFTSSVLSLIGHLVGSAILFVTFFAILWLISFVLHWFDEIHKLPPEIWNFITKIEVWLIYADAFLCAIVVLVGAGRFIMELGELK